MLASARPWLRAACAGSTDLLYRPFEPVSPLDFEIKYMLPEGRVPLVRRHLDTVARRDAEYPVARVHTVYFDTVELACLGEKLSSDYLKTKVRLRWYESLPDGVLSNVFSEVKWRRGARRKKIHVDTGVPGSELASRSLADPFLSRMATRTVAEAGRPSALFPVLALSYRRDRYVDPALGTRISLDSEIAVGRVNPRFLRRRRPGSLGTAVAEFKSPVADLPPSLRYLALLGARKGSFSKYSACFEAAA